MSQGKGERLKKNHSGFTIVELLIAIAILSIVVAAVCGFILVGSRSYASANSDISVQQEAQLALNQMSDVLIDTTRSVNYAGYDASGSPTLVLKDSEFGFEPVAKSLIMYNGAPVVTAPTTPGGTPTTAIEPGNGNKHYQFYWDKVEETLYYTELDVEPGDVDTESNINDRFPAFGDPGWVVLAEHVTKFEVDLTQVEEKRVVQLELTFVNGQREYNTSNNVTIRNKVGVNDAEIGPLDRSKTISVIPKELSVILEPGESFHFSTPKVSGQNVTDKSVTWSMGPGYAGSSFFSDAANGILQVAADEPAGSFTVVITTNATDKDGNHAQAAVKVHVKRVSTVGLSIAGNSTNIVESGSGFTVQAAVGGTSLGVTCDGCGDPTVKDHDVVHQGAVYNWEVVDGAEFVTVENTDVKSADFKVASGAEAGATIRIRATSYLSTVKAYGVVQGELVLTVEAGENAEPFSGKLEYGDNTKLDEIRAGLSTDHPKYVTAVRVVDNSGREPDKVLLYFTTGGGANYRITPDLFDLDLNGSYTFYMQALDPVSKENREKYEKHEIGSVIEDDAATISKEYFANLDTKKPYGYIGDKYPHNKVYYSALNKPKVTYNYKDISYKGVNITYDPVNIYSVGLGSGIIGEIRPSDYESVWGDKWGSITNSLYVGEGNDSTQWDKVYYFDEGSMAYQGSTSLADGAATVSPKGNPFLKLDRNDNKLKICGNYHIVPGMLYQNKDPGLYEIIDYRGFDFPNLPRKERYYEFDDSTIHVRITSEFTMDINNDWFKGKAMFPLPSQMAGDALFPNIHSTDWQISGGELKVIAMKDGNSHTEELQFDYVRYRYIPRNNTYEVEPIQIRKRSSDNKLVIHSYDVYVCEENGSKWQFARKGEPDKDMVFNVKQFEYNGGQYQTYFPLPSESGFPFVNGIEQTTYKVSLYDNNLDKRDNISGALVKAKQTGSTWEIQFIKKIRANAGDSNNHKILVTSYGTYTWSPGETEWTKLKGAEKLPDETDLVVNLSDLERGGKSYKLYFPLPTESDFPFKGTVKKLTDYRPVAYEMSDRYGERPDTNNTYTVEYEKSGDTYQIAFVDRKKLNPNDSNNHQINVVSYGIYTWQKDAKEWTRKEGYREYLDHDEDFVTNLEGVLVNGVSCRMYFPLPGESAFPFKGGVTRIDCTSAHVVYPMTDIHGGEPKYDLQYSVSVKYTLVGNTHRITFCNRWDDTKEYGTFQYTDGASAWTKVTP